MLLLLHNYVLTFSLQSVIVTLLARWVELVMPPLASARVIMESAVDDVIRVIQDTT